MAVTITAAQLAEAVGVDSTTAARLLAVAAALVGRYAPDGTSQREAGRRWHLGTVLPLARLLEAELEAKLETPVRLRFDLYNVDLAGRAQAFQKLVAGGVGVNEALATSGLLADG